MVSNSKIDSPASSDDDVENEEMEGIEELENEEDESADVDGNANGSHSTTRVFLPSVENNKDVQLECDESVYVCYHAMRTETSCLSFDVIPDELGENRADKFPLTMTVVGGTQHEKRHLSSLLVMKMSNMKKTMPSKKDDEDDEDSESDSEDEDESSQPKVDCASVRHAGCVNRVKVTNFNGKVLAASWSELAKVFVWDLTLPLQAVNDHRIMMSYVQNNESPKPLFTFSGHSTEGYALEWSPLIPGMLASGDCSKNIHLWKPLEGGTWHVDQRPLSAHTDSVEDIQWSPNEKNVMATCSVDKSIRIWDIRVAGNKACMITQKDAHDSDVNVISWNSKDPFILSGGDDGKLRVWDLRKFPSGDPICTFKHHTAPITSVEWHPSDLSVFAASGADDQLTQWDLATERDETQEDGTPLSPEVLALPPQLLFIHQGQKEIKELHWHKQMPGVLVSAAQTGFNVIRTLSV